MGALTNDVVTPLRKAAGEGRTVYAKELARIVSERPGLSEIMPVLCTRLSVHRWEREMRARLRCGVLRTISRAQMPKHSAALASVQKEMNWATHCSTPFSRIAQ